MNPLWGCPLSWLSHFFAIIVGIAKRGVTILRIAQNTRGALALSDRAYALDSGHSTLSATVLILLDNPQV
jgi:ABC-type branched-subunit amino acid transport system ATPase component